MPIIVHYFDVIIENVENSACWVINLESFDLRLSLFHKCTICVLNQCFISVQEMG